MTIQNVKITRHKVKIYNNIVTIYKRFVNKIYDTNSKDVQKLNLRYYEKQCLEFTLLEVKNTIK